MGLNLPSSILRYLVLFCCRDSPTYSYEVISKIEEFSGGYWSPSSGTVYPLVDRLIEEGLLEEVSPDDGSEDRNYFRLSEKGEEEIRDVEENMDEYKSDFEDLILGYIHLYASMESEESLEEFKEEVNGVESSGKAC